MKILLTTLHSKYVHSSLALPCIAACCQDIPGAKVVIREWTINESREHLLRLIVAEKADLVAFSCYIWNIEAVLHIVSDLKRISADTLIALGGPEVSFGIFELMNENPGIDFVVKGEGESVFRRLVEILANREISVETNNDSTVTLPKDDDALITVPNLFFRLGQDIASGPMTCDYLQLDSIPSPFAGGLVDLNRALVYYETSRGCPFSCAFCLSSVEGEVRSFSLERIKNDLLFLINQQVPKIKLVDRTFNYDAIRAGLIWEFILKNNNCSHFHFEIAADLLTEENLLLLKQVPEKTFRFEIGVQSTSAKTLQRVGRSGSLAGIFANVSRLRNETNVELHLDLVAGLPGENYQGFLESLRNVAALAPHEIQVEPLKVLKGSEMREIARREGYRFSDYPPYKILSTPWLSFEEICSIGTVGRLLDLFYNREGFDTAIKLLLCQFDFSQLFDKIAYQAGMEHLSGFSTRRLYELFARLAGSLVIHTEQSVFYEALFFDYCQSEMPQMGKLPDFAEKFKSVCAWPGKNELPEGLEFPGNSRIRTFRCSFSHDFRVQSWGEKLVTITFVYISGKGKGLSVVMV